MLVILLAGLVILATSQIVLRNFFSIGLVWADGLIRLGILWLALIGAIAASRDHRHISIDVVGKVLPDKAMVWVAAVRNLFTAGVCALLAWHSWRFVQDSRQFGDTLLGNWPAWCFQIILPIGFGLITYRFLIRTVQGLRSPN